MEPSEHEQLKAENERLKEEVQHLKAVRVSSDITIAQLEAEVSRLTAERDRPPFWSYRP